MSEIVLEGVSKHYGKVRAVLARRIASIAMEATPPTTNPRSSCCAS